MLMNYLPNEKMQQVLSTTNFPNRDAVIILQEKSFIIEDSELEYRGTTLTGPSTTISNILIVKLFNEIAVKRMVPLSLHTQNILAMISLMCFKPRYEY